MTAATGLSGARAFFVRRLESLHIVAGAGAVVAGGAVESMVHGRLRADSPAPVGPRSTFHICSCAKAFTALAFARLVGEGFADWDDPVRTVLPEFALSDPWVAERCTFRDLAGMRLGLSREGVAEWGFRADAPVAMRLARMSAMAFDTPFRDRFSYSNLGYITLAPAVSRITGIPFEQALGDLVFHPLGLADAACRPGPASPSPHMRIAGSATAVQEVTGDNSQGSAQVYLSARDAGAWLSALLDLLRRDEDAAVRELFRPQSMIRPGDMPRPGLPVPWAYAMGWMRADLDGRPVLIHGGGGRGWRAFAVLDPGADTAAMAMTADEGDAVEDLALGLLDIAGGDAPRDRLAAIVRRRGSPQRAAAAGGEARAGPSSRVTHADVAGLYANAVTGEVRIIQTTGGLRFEPADAPVFDATLTETGDGTLAFDFDSPAMSPMPGDPAFEARFVPDSSSGPALQATYFGLLSRAPG
jgi:CubicO group peptidase (beta-lactamase class C family)